VRAGENPLADGGLLALLATDDQRESLQRIYGLMSLLEGHGEVTMSRAGAGHIPNADRFHRVLHARRASATGFSRVMQKALGLEAKLKQYAEGEAFIVAVEAAGGQALMKRVWISPEHLPTYDEIKNPQLWIDRTDVLPSISKTLPSDAPSPSQTA